MVQGAGERRRKLELQPGQRDGHSEIGDPPEAAAGGGQEPVGGEDPWGRGAWATEELSACVGEGSLGKGNGTERVLAGWGLARAPPLPRSGSL